MRPCWGGCVAHLVPASLRVAPCRTPPPALDCTYGRLESNTTECGDTRVCARTGVSGDAERLPTIGSLALIEQAQRTRNASLLAHSSVAYNMEGACARRAYYIYLESDKVYVTNTRDLSGVEQRWGAYRGFRALQLSKHIDIASISPACQKRWCEGRLVSKRYV